MLQPGLEHDELSPKRARLDATGKVGNWTAERGAVPNTGHVTDSPTAGCPAVQDSATAGCPAVQQCI